MRANAWWIGVALVLATTAARAQVGRDVVERGSNRAQISQGKSDLERDTKEVQAFQAQSASLNAAVQAGDGAAANMAMGQLEPLMATEAQQAATKAQAAKKEVAGSASETGSNRRESRRNRDDSDALGRSSDDEADAVRDGVNRVDDARDVAGDKKDLDTRVKLAQREQQIAQTLAPYQFDLATDAGRADATQKLGLVDEFASLMQQDLADTQQEIDEDRREAGEDRRETRDDVREADEPDNRYRRERGDPGRRR